MHQTLCEEAPQNICGAMHRKHPLQRWDRQGPFIRAGLGFHNADCAERPLFEPATPIVMHHFPYRNEEFSRHRLDVLWHGKDTASSRAIAGDIATDHMQARLESLDAVYTGDWSKVRNFIPGTPEFGVQLCDWRDLTPSVDPELATWSAADDGDPP